MLRSLVAVFLLHFLLCVGVSAVGSNGAYPSAGLQDVAGLAQPSHGHEAPGANSDADDHALLDDKQDFPDLLQPHAPAVVLAATAVNHAGMVLVRKPSAAIVPLHKPPKAPGILA